MTPLQKLRDRAKNENLSISNLGQMDALPGIFDQQILAGQTDFEITYGLFESSEFIIESYRRLGFKVIPYTVPKWWGLSKRHFIRIEA
jgi:hypothetical protein